VVPEGEAANHSGNSAWADEKWFYIKPERELFWVSHSKRPVLAQGEAGISPAQVRSAAMLIELLRQPIPDSRLELCHSRASFGESIEHAGRPASRLGFGLPFEAVGLRDNYAAALAHVMGLLDFDCDSNFARRAAPRMRAGIEGAEGILSRRAAAAGFTPAEYKDQACASAIAGCWRRSELNFPTRKPRNAVPHGIRSAR